MEPMQEVPDQHSMHTTIDHTDEDEFKLCEVAKHPFGIAIVYMQVTIGVVAALGLAFFLIPSLVENTEQAFAYASVFGIVAIVLAIAMAIFATIVYRQNRIIVTDRNITQVLQKGLFDRKVSQLNMVNVEDVTSVQKGMFATMFGYGELTIETAGEQSNFHFTYCPHSGYYAKIILNAREKLLGQHDGDQSVTPGPFTTR